MKVVTLELLTTILNDNNINWVMIIFSQVISPSCLGKLPIGAANWVLEGDLNTTLFMRLNMEGVLCSLVHRALWLEMGEHVSQCFRTGSVCGSSRPKWEYV